MFAGSFASLRARPVLRLLCAVVLLAAACGAPPAAPWRPVERREPSVDILSYEIHLDVHHEAGYVQGKVGVTFRALPGRPVREIVLDAVGLDVHRAQDDRGRNLAVDVDEQTLRVHLFEPLPPGGLEQVIVEYDAFPRRGLHFIPPSGTDPGRPWQVWSQGQAEDTRHYMPVWDLPNERATHTLYLTVDSSFTTLCAGDLVDTVRDERNGRRTDVWQIKVPHASYLITLAAGGFATAHLPGEGTPLPVLAEPSKLELALQATEDTRAMLAFFEELTGLPYPYTKYAQIFVEDFTAGGMENVSATTLYEEGLCPRAAGPQVDIGSLIAHELAHQWYGDLITNRSWGEVWLNEGLATWCELAWLEHHRGRAEMEVELRGNQRAAVAGLRFLPRPMIWHGYDDPDEMFDVHAYEGGAARLHLLRTQLGDERFFAGLRRYTEVCAGQVVETADFLRAFHEGAGVALTDLERFFDTWFHDVDFPIFRATLQPDAQQPTEPILSVEQVQRREGMRAHFPLTVVVAWSRGGAERSAPLAFDAPRAALRLEGEGPLDWVRFDAGSAVLGEAHLHQSQAMWTAQLRRASDPVTRLVAAEWFLRAAPTFNPQLDEDALDAAALEALHAAARHDDFVFVRTTALAALRHHAHPASKDLLLALAEDDDARVREQALLALGDLEGDDVLSRLSAAVDDPNGRVATVAVSGLVRRDFPGAFSRLRKRFLASDQVRLSRDLAHLAGDVADPLALPFLIGVARQHPERWVRAAAVTQLGRSGWRFPEHVFRQLCRSLGDESHSVRTAAAEALGRRGESDARVHLQARLVLEDDVFVRRSLLEALDALR